jgi:hypothetical protein
MWEEVTGAIAPGMGLRKTLENWHGIRRDLAEGNRKRRPQVEAYHSKTS